MEQDEILIKSIDSQVMDLPVKDWEFKSSYMISFITISALTGNLLYSKDEMENETV